MERKSSLRRHRKYKQKRGTIDLIYDNSRASTLLAEARAGFLKTKQFWSRFEEIDTCCNGCGRVETVEHVILNCHGRGFESGSVVKSKWTHASKQSTK